jgi:alpha-tubulin suppressor-like RCC1 family protein
VRLIPKYLANKDLFFMAKVTKQGLSLEENSYPFSKTGSLLMNPSTSKTSIISQDQTTNSAAKPMTKHLILFFCLLQTTLLLADPASEFAKLLPIDIDTNDDFGDAVAVEGNIMVVGAKRDEATGTSKGVVYIYALSDNTWIFQTKITPSTHQSGDQFGYSVGISGNQVIVGALYSDPGGMSNSGAAYIFANTSGNTWVEQAQIYASDRSPNDQFGFSVALSGNIAIASTKQASLAGFDRSGAAYVFANTSANAWVEQSKLTGGTPHVNRYYGQSVAAQGNVVAVGSFRDNHVSSSAGAVFIYANSSANIWDLQSILTPGDIASNDEFGNSVSLSGNLLLAGSPGDDVEGAAYIFANTSGNTWAEQAKLEPSDGISQDSFGTTVILSGNNAVIGAINHDALASNAGTAYLFTRSSPTVWVEQEKFLAGDSDIDNKFGTSIGMSGNLLAIGTPFESTGGTGAGAVYTFDITDLDHAPVISPSPTIDFTFDEGQSSLSINSSNISVNDLDNDDVTWSVIEHPSHGNITTFTFTGNQINTLTYQSDFTEPVGDIFVLEASDGSFERQITVSVGKEFTELSTLYPIDGLSSTYFGQSISTDGRFMIVGTPAEATNGSGSGAAYIYARSGNSWIFQYKIFASDAEPSDNFGSGVAISGNLAIVGAHMEDSGGSNAGAAYVFANTSANIWIEQAKLTSDLPNANAQFGRDVGISGNQVIVSAHNDGTLGTLAGAAFIFANTSGNQWVQQARLNANDNSTYDYFGTDVAFSGNRVLIGARGEEAAYIFANTGGNSWIQTAKFEPNDQITNDQFSMFVALSGNVALISSPVHDSAATDGGAVYVYAKDHRGPWYFQDKLTASDAGIGDQFGESLSISGKKAVIGTYRKEGLKGGAYAFTYIGGNVWVEEQRLNNPSASASDSFGRAVAIDGELVVVGVINDDTLAPNAGALNIFELKTIAPYISPDLRFHFAIAENDSLTLDFTDIEADSYYGTPLTWTLAVNGMNGDVTDLSTSGNLITSLVYEPNPSFSGADSFILRVTDSAGSVKEQEIKIFVLPTPIELPAFSKVGAGPRTVFAYAGGDYLLGGANDIGQMALGFTSQNIETMMSINLGPSANQMAMGTEHGIVLDDNGHVWTWGNNDFGQLGQGDTTLRSSATQVIGLQNIIRVYAGAYSSYAVNEFGVLFAWGRNTEGQLGIDMTSDQLSPYTVALNGKLEDLSVGISHALAVIEGDLYAWGSDGFQQLGDGLGIDDINNRDEPKLIDNSISWKRVFAGGFHSHAMSSTNTIYAWGKNDRGQLGVGHNSPIFSANTTVVSLSDIKNISSGYEHSLFLDDVGQVWATGSSRHGQIANNTDLATPQVVPGLTTSANNEIATGPFSSYYLQASPNEVYVWGRRPNGDIVIPTLYFAE